MTDKEIKDRASNVADRIDGYYAQYSYPSASVARLIIEALTEVRDACLGWTHDETMSNVERALEDERT